MQHTLNIHHAHIKKLARFPIFINNGSTVNKSKATAMIQFLMEYLKDFFL